MSTSKLRTCELLPFQHFLIISLTLAANTSYYEFSMCLQFLDGLLKAFFFTAEKKTIFRLLVLTKKSELLMTKLLFISIYLPICVFNIVCTYALNCVFVKTLFVRTNIFDIIFIYLLEERSSLLIYVLPLHRSCCSFFFMSLSL